MKVHPGAVQDWKPIANQLETYIEFLMSLRKLCAQQIKEYEKRAENLKHLSSVQAESLKYYKIVLESLQAISDEITKDETVTIVDSIELSLIHI